MSDEALALAFRAGLPYVGLRDHAHDPELDGLIPPDAARTARAIPLAADDDRVRLAVADPEPDLSALDRFLSGRKVDLALAPREELDQILGPPPRVVDVGEHAAFAAEPEPDVAEEETLAAQASLPPAPEEAPVGDEDGVGTEAEVVAVEPGAADEAPAAALAAAAAASPPPDDHPELDGEVPSWLAPRRRRWRVVLVVLIVLLVLIAAGVAVYAYLNA